jgi:hypothetical protein
MSFINVFEQILDYTNVVADLNVDVRIIFDRQKNIMGYHPTIVQFNAMNQNCVPRIYALINRISIYIRHRLELELAWILFFAFAIFHAWGIWKCNSTWTMHLATVSWANLFVSGFRSSTLTMRSTSSTVCGL